MSERLTPVFFEILSGQAMSQARIIPSIRANLMQRGVSPLPFADSEDALAEILDSLFEADCWPGLFVVNTFGAEKYLARLDEIMEATPVLFFRRELVWLQEEQKGASTFSLTAQIQNMRPRLTAVKDYGKANCAEVAQWAAVHIEKYLRTKNFRCLETLPSLSRDDD
jgi:hypothetical protein